MNNAISCKSILNEGSPFEFSIFKDQFIIVVRQVLTDKKTNCWCADRNWFLLVIKEPFIELTVGKTDNCFLWVSLRRMWKQKESNRQYSLLFSISTFTYNKQLQGKKAKKTKKMQVRKRKTKHDPTRTAD